MVSTRSRSYDRTPYDSSIDSSGTYYPYVSKKNSSPSARQSHSHSQHSVNSTPFAFHPYARPFKPSPSPHSLKSKGVIGFRLPKKTRSDTVTLAKSPSIRNHEDVVNLHQDQDQDQDQDNMVTTTEAESIGDNTFLEENTTSVQPSVDKVVDATCIPKNIIRRTNLYSKITIETILSILLVLLYLFLIVCVVRGIHHHPTMYENKNSFMYKNMSVSNQDHQNMCWI